MSQNNKNNRTNKIQMPRITAKIDKMVDGNGSTRAYASINVAGALAVHGLRVMDSSKGLFVSMPSRSYKDQSGKMQYSDIAYAVTKDVHNAISTKVLEAYEQALQESESETDGFTEMDGDEDLPFDEDDAEGYAQSM